MAASQNCAVIPMQMIMRRSSKKRQFLIQILCCLLPKSMPYCLYKNLLFICILYYALLGLKDIVLVSFSRIANLGGASNW
jgi:hypothetical protein